VFWVGSALVPDDAALDSADGASSQTAHGKEGDMHRAKASHATAGLCGGVLALVLPATTESTTSTTETTTTTTTMGESPSGAFL